MYVQEIAMELSECNHEKWSYIAGRRTDDMYPTTLPLVLGPRMYNERRNNILNLNFKIGEMRNQILSVHRHRPTTTTTNNTIIIIIIIRGEGGCRGFGIAATTDDTTTTTTTT